MQNRDGGLLPAGDDMASKGSRRVVEEGLKRQAAALGDRLISVNRLHLNLANPRHEPASSESEAIARLCDSELIAELAQDIAQRGSLSPLEVLGVMPMPGNPGHFISLEGNRRTCALIVAADPGRAPASIRSQLKRITADASLPKQVKAHVFPSEAEAKQWIDLRHLGQQGGAGTKDWDPTQQNRATGGNTKTSARDNTLSVRVLDRLVARGLLTPEQRRLVSVSTITRYLGTPAVRAILGLGSHQELIYTHDHNEVDRALVRLVIDSIERANDGSYRVNSRTDSAARLKYVNELKASGDAPVTPLGQPEHAPPPTKVSRQAESARGSQKRSAAHPDKRKSLIPSNFPISFPDPVLSRLRHEGLNLPLSDYSFSGNYILRALVEQTMTLFAKKRGKWNENMTDAGLQQACASELKAMGVTGKALSVVQRAAGNNATPYSLHSLGHAVHGGSIPAATDLKKYFDTWRPSLEAMLSALTKDKSRVK